MNNNIKKITTMAMLSAIAYVVVVVGRIPVVLFLKYDPKDIIITLGGLIWGSLVCVCAAPISDEWRKTLDLFFDFPYWIYTFRSILYAFRSLHPKITENLPIN